MAATFLDEEPATGGVTFLDEEEPKGGVTFLEDDVPPAGPKPDDFTPVVVEGPFTRLPGEVVNPVPGYRSERESVDLTGIAPLDPVADTELRKREIEMGIPQFSLGPAGLQDAIGEALYAEKQKPYVAIPKPENTGVGTGIARAGIGFVESLETPENMGLLGGVGAAGKLVQQAASMGFGASMIKGAVDQFINAPEGETEGQKAERITTGVLSLLLGGVAAKHGTGVRAPVTAAERAVSMEAAREQTSNAGATPGGSPPIPEPTPSPAAPAPTLAEPAVAQRVSAAGEAPVEHPAGTRIESDWGTYEKRPNGEWREVDENGYVLSDTRIIGTPKGKVTETPASSRPAGEAPATTPATEVVGESKPVKQADAAAKPEQLIPEEIAALRISKLKGAENRGDGIVVIPEKLMTPERRKQIMRGGNSVEVKPLSDVTGDPYSRGYAILDRRARRAFRNNSPVSVDAVDAYGIKLPDGYVKQGDLYVKKGATVTETPATSSTRPAGQGEAPPLQSELRPTSSGERVVELLPEQAEVAAPKLDVKRSPFALGISPDAKVMTWLSSNVKRLFTATGDLPKQTFEGWIERNGFVKEQSRQTAYATRDLYSALKDEFKISTTETLTKGFEKVPPAFVKQMNQALLGEVDINTLPERVRAPLQAMRDHVDAMSQKMLSEGVVPAELQAKVADNLGTYLTRSYRIFDDPVWAEKIPQDVRNRVRDFIHSNLKKTDPAATPETARAVMESMLQDWKDQGTGALVKTGGKLGSKDLTSFIARKDIPQVLREVMGEYSDPTINYTRSVTKMANLIGSQRFLGQVRAQGMGKFLFEDGKQPATHTARIAAEGSDVMAPLNGLRTTPEIATAFREFGKMDPIKNPIFRALATLSGVAKSVKTVGSVMTQARNLLGQSYFFAMNGHFDMRAAAPALRAVLADLGARDTPAGRAAYQRYLRLGIVDQSARASELRDIIRDAGLNDPGVTLTEPGSVLAKSARKLTVDAAAKGYQLSDDLGKIIGFENELARQRSIHPEWSETTLEATSAERIRNTYPTYSMVPKAVQNIRRLPIAPFASFAAETFRTAYHNLRYTIEDLQSTNPAQKKAGAQRLAGQLAVVGSGYAMSAITQALLGMNAQEEDDARRFMAPWDKDSQIAFTGKGDGEAKFVNLSYVNPYSYLTDPVVAVAGGLRDADQLDEIMLRSMEKLLQPFTSEDIFAGAVVDVARNKTKTGGRVFNPGDTTANRLVDQLGHILKTLEPGTVSRVKSKIIPAVKGETDRHGRKPELTTEILNELTGFKQQTIDYKQALGFRALAFKKADDDADSIFREVAAQRGSVSQEDLTDAYKRATRSKFETWQEFYRDVQAARRRGVSDSAIKTAIEARGVSQAEAGSVMDGKFVPPKVSPALAKQMKDNNRSLPPDAEKEQKRAAGLVLSGRFQ